MLETLKPGSSGSLVRAAQLLTGYAAPEGRFDAEFEAWIKAWQNAQGLSADGVIGPKTWQSLAQAAPAVSARSNRKGAYALALQLLLGDVEADGVFGPDTCRSLIQAQTAAGLKADGVAGKKTWAYLICGEKQADAPQPPDFKQYDARWADKMYSSHGDAKQTMKTSGCGPTAMADIVAAWWDKEITPYELAKLSVEWGTRTYNSGTSGAFFKSCALKYGAGSFVRTAGTDAAISCLNKGGLVIASLGPSRWTKGGHYCCLWKYAGGVFYINDPASAAPARARGTYDEIRRARKLFYCFTKQEEK